MALYACDCGHVNFIGKKIGDSSECSKCKNVMTIMKFESAKVTIQRPNDRPGSFKIIEPEILEDGDFRIESSDTEKFDAWVEENCKPRGLGKDFYNYSFEEEHLKNGGHFEYGPYSIWFKKDSHYIIREGSLNATPGAGHYSCIKTAWLGVYCLIASEIDVDRVPENHPRKQGVKCTPVDANKFHSLFRIGMMGMGK